MMNKPMKKYACERTKEKEGGRTVKRSDEEQAW